jgi:hypothetical protein
LGHIVVSICNALPVVRVVLPLSFTIAAVFIIVVAVNIIIDGIVLVYVDIYIAIAAMAPVA